MKSSIKCPNCGSTAVRSRSAVHKSGTSNYSGRHSSSGLSFGLGKKFNPRLWFGGGSHRGRRQSLIAQEAAPLPVWLGFPILIIVFIFSGGSIYLSIGVAICWGIFAFTYNSKTYDKQWVCSKCGSFFDYEDAEVIQAASRVLELGDQLIPLFKTLVNVNENKEKLANREDIVKINKIIDELEDFMSEDHSHLPEDIQEDISELSEVIDSAKSTSIVAEIKRLWPHVHSGQSKTALKRNAQKILELLNKLDDMDEENIIDDFDNFRAVVGSIIKTTDAVYLLDKAEDKHLLGDKKGELKYLSEAFHSLIRSKITKKEFDSIRAKSDITGQVWTIKILKQRLLDAGYKSKNDIKSGKEKQSGTDPD